MQDQKLTALPPLGNRYEEDAALKQIIAALPKSARDWAQPVLQSMGATSANDLVELAQTANKKTPVLNACDRFGTRIDFVEFHPAYEKLKEASYGQGIVAHYYDPSVRKILGEHGEIVKFAQGYLFSQAEQGLYCPICMTDGVAFLIETFGSAAQKQEFLPHLTSTRMDSLWEGAMFLTERAGGSDVGATETIAKPVGDGTYALSGKKWFCSNASAEAAAVLARIDDAKAGTGSLGLFLLRKHKVDGTLNNQQMDRLKDKLGTRSMPTGEITLDRAIGQPLGDLTRGFVEMAEMLNLSRLYNATASVSIVRSVLSEAVRYCRSRHAFGKSLISFPLVQDKLVEISVECEAALQLLFVAHGLRGKVLSKTASDDERRLLRIMTPLLKYRTAALAVRSASDCLELHGGNGYIEDFPLARLYRDAQVLPVWEGSTNMMILDAVRAMVKDQAHEVLLNYIEERNSDKRVQERVRQLKSKTAAVLARSDISTIDATAKTWCDMAYETAQAATLLHLARDQRAQTVAEQFLMRHLTSGEIQSGDSVSKACNQLLSASYAGCLA